MGFQAFAHHFGGLAGFEVFVEGDFFGFLFELDFVALAQGVLRELVFAVAQLQLGGKRGEFALFGGQGFADGEFALQRHALGECLVLRLQFGKLALFFG